MTTLSTCRCPSSLALACCSASKVALAAVSAAVAAAAAAASFAYDTSVIVTTVHMMRMSLLKLRFINTQVPLCARISTHTIVKRCQ
jgi:hypothetical protein